RPSARSSSGGRGASGSSTKTTAFPPPWSRPATAAFQVIASARRNASRIPSVSRSYGQKRIPPRAGPSAVEWIAITARSAVARSATSTTCSWPCSLMAVLISTRLHATRCVAGRFVSRAAARTRTRSREPEADMASEVRGVISAATGAPVTVETIVVPDPGPGEATVQIQACGVCHTDLHYREGAITDAFPFLLGHEAAGIVEAVGDGVVGLAPGDFVVLN